MNNEELAAVCEGHDGKPWWPDGLAYHDDLNQWLADVEIADTVNESHHFKIKLEPDAAADMILGSAVRWLALHGEFSPLFISPCIDPDCQCGRHLWECFEVGTSIGGIVAERVFQADTMLAAVLAACKAVKA